MPGADDTADEVVDVAVDASALGDTEDVTISGSVLVAGTVTPLGKDDMLFVGGGITPVTPPLTAPITTVDDGVSAP